MSISFFSRTKKGFTLVELLIVIVIIGILAAALIPRLLSVQSRARDTKRRADISQIGSALSIYKLDYITFNGISGYNTSNGLRTPLVTSGAYMSAMPKDSLTSDRRGIYDMVLATIVDLTGGSYAFATLERNGRLTDAFGLMARTENRALSNRVYILDGGDSQAMYVDDTILNYNRVCRTIGSATEGAGSFTADGPCFAAATELRYIYTQ